MSDRLVSVCMITYNQEKFIAQAIEGVLMQKTNFAIELIIAEDFSTDNTKIIIQEYVEKYPLIIKPIYRQPNLGMMPNLLNALSQCKGKFIALCEGDDYWTDPYKIQKQFDLLEKYPNASMCVALNKQIYEQTGMQKVDMPYKGKHFPLIYFKNLSQYFHTSTYLIRKATLDFLTKKYLHLFKGDTAMRYLLINEGPFVVLNEVVSVYRITGLGVWSSLNQSSSFFANYILYRLFRKNHKSKRAMYYFSRETAYLTSSIIFSIWEKMKR